MYGKLFQSMFDGSLAQRGPWEALVTFMALIALADREGFIDMTPEAISRRTLIPLDIVRKGIGALEQPDPESRDPSQDGRRIERISDHRSWGWKIVNYVKYRQLRTADERREYMREHMRQRRAAEKAPGKPGPTGSVPRETSPQPVAPSGRGMTLEAFLEGHMEKKGDSGLEQLISHWMGWARAHRPDLLADQVFKSFRDHWKANANQRTGKKVDWEAAWRNWVRKEPVAKLQYAQRGGPVSDGKIACAKCGTRVTQHTDGLCDPCWRAR